MALPGAAAAGHGRLQVKGRAGPVRGRVDGRRHASSRVPILHARAPCVRHARVAPVSRDRPRPIRCRLSRAPRRARPVPTTRRGLIRRGRHAPAMVSHLDCRSPPDADVPRHGRRMPERVRILPSGIRKESPRTHAPSSARSCSPPPRTPRPRPSSMARKSADEKKVLRNTAEALGLEEDDITISDLERQGKLTRYRARRKDAPGTAARSPPPGAHADHGLRRRPRDECRMREARGQREGTGAWEEPPPSGARPPPRRFGVAMRAGTVQRRRPRWHSIRSAGLSRRAVTNRGGLIRR